MKMIDADALIIKVQELIKEYERRMPEYSANDMLTSGKDAAMKWGYKADGVEDALKLIIDAPIIKAEPIKNGRWIVFPECLEYEDALDTDYIVCSECHHVWNVIDNCTETFKCCPSCGARMDGDVNER